MASVSKKLTLNFSRGRMTKKKRESRDDASLLACEHSRDDLTTFTMSDGVTKSSSLANLTQAEPALSNEDISALTASVHGFSKALSSLKDVFIRSQGGGEEMRVSGHESLAELLCVLKGILQRYPTLHTVEVLTMAAELISAIKGYPYDEVPSDNTNMLYAIDQLALAFSSSVSEYLMGDINSYPLLSKTKSQENLLVGDTDLPKQETLLRNHDPGVSAQDLDTILQKLDSGVEIALQRAKAWAKYTKEILNYVEKKIAFEADYAKNVAKLASSARQIIAEDTYVLFQSIYFTALDQDADFARTDQYTCSLIQTERFVAPLNARRIEHEKNRKILKDMWTKELRRMQEAVVNVRKAKGLYMSREQEYRKLKEGAQRADTDTTAAKAERKKKQLEDALHRAIEAETTYKACVEEANNKQTELERVKGEILAAIRELIYRSDQIMKSVTVDYFQLLHTLTATAPLRLQWLHENSQQYEPGMAYAEYVRRIPVHYVSAVEPFVFEPYSNDNRLYEQRKASLQSSGSGSDVQVAPDDRNERAGSADLWGRRGDDTDSVSGSSSKSVDSSPSASPYQSRSRRRDAVNQLDPGLLPHEVSLLTFHGVSLSHAARTHMFRRLRTPSRCRACDTYVFFQGAECAQCGLSSHKKCLETLNWQCDDQKMGLQRRMTTFGVDFSAHVRQTHTQVPYLVRKCVAEIDERGLDIKGIYRLSAVKSKVEKLCQNFETETEHVDLSEHHPNVIANVLKLYLRQLPEPLLSFKLYPHLIKLAKDELSSGAILTGSSEPVALLKQLIEQLPRPNFMTCGMLMNHLKRVSECEEINQMSSSNLGIVFGPTLLRPREGAASLDSLMDTPHQTRIVELLITNVMTIFFPGMEANETLTEPGIITTPDQQPEEEEDADYSIPLNEDAAEVKLRSQSMSGSLKSAEAENRTSLLAELAQEDPRFNQMNNEESSQENAVDGATENASEENSYSTLNSLPAIGSTDSQMAGTSPGLRRRLLAADLGRGTDSRPPPIQLTQPFSYSPSMKSRHWSGAGATNPSPVAATTTDPALPSSVAPLPPTPNSPSTCPSTTDSSSASSATSGATDRSRTELTTRVESFPKSVASYHRISTGSDPGMLENVRRERQPRYV